MSNQGIDITKYKDKFMAQKDITIKRDAIVIINKDLFAKVNPYYTSDMSKFEETIEEVVSTMYHEAKLQGLDILDGDKIDSRTEHINGYGKDYEADYYKNSNDSLLHSNKLNLRIQLWQKLKIK